MFHMHKWSSWTSMGTVSTYEYGSSKYPYKTEETMKGTCSVCGMIKTKKVKL